MAAPAREPPTPQRGPAQFPIDIRRPNQHELGLFKFLWKFFEEGQEYLELTSLKEVVVACAKKYEELINERDDIDDFPGARFQERVNCIRVITDSLEQTPNTSTTRIIVRSFKLASSMVYLSNIQNYTTSGRIMDNDDNNPFYSIWESAATERGEEYDSIEGFMLHHLNATFEKHKNIEIAFDDDGNYLFFPVWDSDNFHERFEWDVEHTIIPWQEYSRYLRVRSDHAYSPDDPVPNDDAASGTSCFINGTSTSAPMFVSLC